MLSAAALIGPHAAATPASGGPMATGSSKTAPPALGTGHLWWTVEQHLLDAMAVFCVGREATPREGHFEIDAARIADDAQFDGLHVLRTNSTMNMLSVARLTDCALSQLFCVSLKPHLNRYWLTPRVAC
jgi:hypothetical protein